jgi:N-acetylglucosamine-6-phosphate deacetylase
MPLRTIPATFVAAALLSFTLIATAAPPSTKPVEGLHRNTPQIHALTNLRIVIEPGKVIEKGSIVIRDGVITAVGADIAIPPDARLWPHEGATAYAGFLDAYGETRVPDSDLKGAGYWNPLVAPQLSLAHRDTVDVDLNKTLRSQGITARLVAPSGRIIQGQSVLVTTGDQGSERAILQDDIALHMRLTVPFQQTRGSYPNSPMGAVALARQVLLDAQWYGQATSAQRAGSNQPRPERNDALQALLPFLHEQRMVVFEAPNDQFFLRADRFAREFGLNAVIRGSGSEYRNLEAIRATGRAVILPLNFPSAPAVATAEDALDVSLATLMHWDIAPENPARLDKAGVPIAFTSHGLKDQGEFLQAVRRAVARGLEPDSALRALTTTPAKLFGVGDRLGTIAAGKEANLVITDGELFSQKTKVRETWVDGQRFEMTTPPVVNLRGTWKLRWDSEKSPVEITLKLSGSPNSLAGTLQPPAAKNEKEKLADKTKNESDDKGDDESDVKLTAVQLRDLRLTFGFDAKAFGHAGPARATAVVLESNSKKPSLAGEILWASGEIANFSATFITAEKKSDEDKSADKHDEKKESKGDQPSLYPVNYPLGDFGRAKPPEAPQKVLFTHANIWTCSSKGMLENASLLVGNGKILAVGVDLPVPKGAVVVDLAGQHISPGIIDCHSHMATDGGINETGQAITAEVRIGDFIDARDINIYRQLAGGVTTANVLHGSANPIGGQNQVIKLRWGELPEDMKFREAPAGIKFALGENVKQSNWGENFTTRYPQTRMGVDQIFRDSFAAAQAYQQEWDRWNQDRTAAPPRRDLELEAIAEILAGNRWIHCHSYRQDEILALLRLCEGYKIRIGTLQHILEGYKVADVMARHGVMGSSFSDWWAYKFEVIDAIPYNGAMMHNAGVVVSFNSDDAELARHLNHEAAKAVKYGGLSPEEALKFVTLNPAKQLRIDKYVGSLEPGKQADFVVWSTAPLSTLSRCEQTWINGRKYFDRAEDQAQRAEQAKMRTALVRRILDSGQPLSKNEGADDDDASLWPRHDEFCAHGRDHSK